MGEDSDNWREDQEIGGGIKLSEGIGMGVSRERTEAERGRKE